MAHLRVRVDDRLVHSEVIYGELEAAAFDLLVVAAGPERLARVDTAMVPRATRVVRVAPADVSEELSRRAGEAVLVVVADVADLMAARAAGLVPDAVVLANRAARSETVALAPTFHADGADLARLSRLIEDGVPVHLQRIPAQPPVPLDGARLARLRAELESPRAGGGSSEPC